MNDVSCRELALTDSIVAIRACSPTKLGSSLERVRQSPNMMKLKVLPESGLRFYFIGIVRPCRKIAQRRRDVLSPSCHNSSYPESTTCALISKSPVSSVEEMFLVFADRPPAATATQR